jgi:hypothetical protein
MAQIWGKRFIHNAGNTWVYFEGPFSLYSVNGIVG